MAQFAPKEKKVSKKSEPIGWQVVYHRAAEDGPKTKMFGSLRQFF
jgi:hypothetical protein